MSSIFGGSKEQSSETTQSQSQSGNQAYPMLSQALGGQVSNGTNASNALSGLLGVGGDQAAAQAGFKNFQNSTGYQFGLDQGGQAITQNAATKGLLNSGATLRGLNTFGQNYANTQYGNYANQLQSLLSGGNQAASIIGSAGNQSSSSSTGHSTKSGSSSNGNGIGGFIGALL
jgi:hypothetical protein